MSTTLHDLGSYTLRVLEEGDGPGLLYLHGFEHHPGDAPFLHRFASTHRVIAPELPGYGASTGFDSVHDVLDIALVLRRLMTERGFDRYDVVGHSLGGMIAAEVAVIAQPAVQHLVLVDAYGLWLDDEPCLDVLALSARELAAAKWHDPSSADRETSIEPVDHDPLSPMLTRMQNLAVATKFLWPLPDRGMSRRLPYVRAETLVVHGGSDGLIPPSYARAIGSKIPDADVEIVDEAGHLPMVEREDEFFAVVDPFLARKATAA